MVMEDRDRELLTHTVKDNHDLKYEPMVRPYPMRTWGGKLPVRYITQMAALQHVKGEKHG